MLRAIESTRCGHWTRDAAVDTVTLDYDHRHRRRIRLRTDGGRDLLLDLPKAVPLANGDGLRLEDGGWVEVRAAQEALLEIRAGDPWQLLRLAWHVGNRHVPAEILADAIRIRPDHVIAKMIEGLGGTVLPVDAAFQPEGGAYAGGHAHGHGHGHAH